MEADIARGLYFAIPRARTCEALTGTNRKWVNCKMNRLGVSAMGIAERIYEVVKELPEATAAEVLDYAETKRTRAAAMAAQTARRTAALALLDKHAGRFRKMRFNRAELYDRAGLR